MGKSTISMVIFNSKLLVITRRKSRMKLSKPTEERIVYRTRGWCLNIEDRFNMWTYVEGDGYC
jgi:hypothetical protein